MGRMLKKLVKFQSQPVGQPQDVNTPKQNLATASMQTATQIRNNPTAALSFSSFTPKPGEADPRDATYWSNVSNLLFNTQRQQSEGLLAQQRSTLDYQRGLGDMQTDRGREQRGLAEEAMRGGLANSGWLNRADSEDTYDFLRQREDYQTNYERDRTDRASSLSAGIQDYLAGERDQAIGSLERYQEGQLGRAEDEAPLYDPTDIRKLNRILRPRKRGGGGGGGKRGGGKRGKR